MRRPFRRSTILVGCFSACRCRRSPPLAAAFPGPRAACLPPQHPPLCAVELCVTKDGIKFAAAGDIGSATVMCRQNSSGEEDEQTLIDMNETVSLTFALRYLVNFTKATPLSHTVVSAGRPSRARPG